MGPLYRRELAREQGMSLLELLVALAIVATLLVLALPAYQQHMVKSGRAVATAELRKLAIRQEQFRLGYKRYATALSELGLPAAGYSLDRQGERLAARSTDGVYLIGLSTLGWGYRVSATPVGAQQSDNECGTLGLDYLGLRSASGSGGVARCW